MINRVVLVGRLTKDPELRYTQSGAAVASFTIAVNRTFTNSNGEREADFINCVIWRKAAENFANFANKGSLVGIDGRLQSRSYDNKQGQKVFVTEMVVDNFSMLESRAESQQRNSNDSKDYSNKLTEKSQKPVANNGSDPFADNSKPIDISQDDLPF